MRAKIWRKLRGGVWASGLPLLIAVFASAIVLTLSYSTSVVPVPPAGAAEGTPNLTGWGWSSNVGWVSVNCANTAGGCAGGEWGLELEPEVNGKRYISGYAWNDKIGWIRFDQLGPYPGQAADNTVQDAAYLNVADGRILGFARACNVFESDCFGTLKPDTERGGWDGWISLGRTDSVAGTNPPASPAQTVYGVQAVRSLAGNNTSIDIDFKYFAWGQTIIGWLNMAPMTGVGITCLNCDGAPPMVTLSANPASLVSSGNTTLTWTTQNADICTASGGWSGAKDRNGGSQSPISVPQTTTFIIECTNQVGRAVAEVTVTVGADDNLLSVILAGNGTGKVQSTAPNTSDILCQNFNPVVNTCVHGYSLSPIVNASLSSAVNADDSSRFEGWFGDTQGAFCSTSNCNSLVMNQDRDVFAVFNRGADPVLTIIKVGDGDGTVSTPIGPVSCGLGCDSVSVSMPRGISVNISQNAAAGSTFGGWSGDCAGTGACSVTMSGVPGDRTVVVRFDATVAPTTFELTVNISGDRSGEVDSSPAGINNCTSGSCKASFNQNQLVSLTPTYDSNTVNVAWTGCETIDNDVCRVTMDQAQEVTAEFSCASGCGGGGDAELTIQMTGSGTGQVKRSDGLVLCDKTGTATKSCTVDNGSSIGDLLFSNTGTISASGQFQDWSGCSAGSSGANCNYNISNSDQTVTADFGDGNPPGCTPGVDCFCDLNPTDPTCDGDPSCTPGVDCVCDLDPLDPSCALPQCIANASVLGLNNKTFDFSLSQAVQGTLRINITTSGAVKVNINTVATEINNSDKSGAYTDHVICPKDGSATPATPCSNELLDLDVNNTTYNGIRFWIYGPSQGGVGTDSVYYDCNGANGERGCKVTAEITGTGANCTTNTVPVDYYVKYKHGNIQPTKAGPTN